MGRTWYELSHQVSDIWVCTCPSLPKWRTEGVTRTTVRHREKTWRWACRCSTCECHSKPRSRPSRTSRWELENAPKS